MCSILFVSTQVHAYKYGLGSCLDQNLDQAIWPAIQEEKLDGFIFLGDNVYGDQPNGQLFKMKNAYEIQKTRLPKWLMMEKEILAIWDDHDFGLNDGGKNYLYKKKKKRYQSISSVVCKGLESEILDRRYFIDVSAFVECPETLITICAKKRRNCAKMNIGDNWNNCVASSNF